MKNYFEIEELIKNYGVRKIFVAGIKELYRKIWLELILNSYSQSYEDLALEKLFPQNYLGTYLEIGAYHPVRLSNTYRFYKKGWRGVVVEPNPSIKKLFGKIRPEDKFLSMGISNKNIKLNYYQFLIPALNTFSKKEARIKIIEGHKLNKIIKIKTIRVDEIIKSQIDFLSIDTEGMDGIILKSWPWEKYKPKAICIETDKNDNRIEKIVTENGYEKYFENNFNSIFVLKKLELEDDRKQ